MNSNTSAYFLDKSVFEHGGVPRHYFGEGILPLRSTLASKPVFTNTFEAIGTSAQNDVWYPLTNKGTQTLTGDHVLAASGGQSDKVVAGANQTSPPLEIARKLTTGFAAATSSVRFRYFVENDGQDGSGNGLTSLSFRMYNDTAFTNGWQVTNLPCKQGVWHDLEFTNSTFDLTKIGTPNWANPILAFTILANGVTGVSNLPIVHFDFIEVIPTGAAMGGVALTLDDAFSSQIENAVTYCLKAGVPVTVFVTANKISSGDAQYSTWSRLQEFDRTGMVEWGMHWTGADQSGFPYDNRPSGGVPSIDEKHQYMVDAKSSLASQGFLGYTPDLFALPSGTDGSAQFGRATYNDFLIMRQHCSIVRGTKQFWSASDGTVRDGTGSTGINDMGNLAYAYIPRYRRHTWWYPAATFGGSSAYPTNHAAYDLFTAAIDRVVANKDVLIDYEHNIGASNIEVFSMLTADWQARIDYVRSKIDAGTLQALRFSDLMF